MNRPAVQFRVPRIAESAVERARLVVVPRTRTAAPRFPFLVLVSTVILVGIVGLLLFNTQMQKAAFGGRQMEAERANLTVRHQELSQELLELRSYQNVAARAQELGMVLPPVLPSLKLADGSIDGSRVTAGAEDRVPLRPRTRTNPYELAQARKARAAKVAAAEAARKAQDAARKAQQQKQREATTKARRNGQKKPAGTGAGARA